jgi:hypothetical protein
VLATNDPLRPLLWLGGHEGPLPDNGAEGETHESVGRPRASATDPVQDAH